MSYRFRSCKWRYLAHRGTESVANDIESMKFTPKPSACTCADYDGSGSRGNGGAYSDHFGVFHTCTKRLEACSLFSVRVFSMFFKRARPVRAIAKALCDVVCLGALSVGCSSLSKCPVSSLYKAIVHLVDLDHLGVGGLVSLGLGDHTVMKPGHGAILRVQQGISQKVSAQRLQLSSAPLGFRQERDGVVANVLSSVLSTSCEAGSDAPVWQG